MRSNTGSKRSENPSFEINQESIVKLILDGRFWTVYEIFRSINGTRVWENRFATSNDPLIIECVDEDKCGNMKFPHWMLLTREHFKNCRPGKSDNNGEKTREVPFPPLPKIPFKIMRATENVKRR